MVHKKRHIPYRSDSSDDRHQLDVYYSKKDPHRDVIVFVPGGAWESENKNLYRLVGRNFVRKGFVAVIINYRLTPNRIDSIADDCSAAVFWVVTNIHNYGGNSQRIFLLGHSAGGHLISLINADPRFFAKYHLHHSIKGLILLDAFGLDMYEYLHQPSSRTDRYYQTFLQVFTRNPRVWQQASPMHYIQNIRNPQLILVGDRTYATIQRQNRRLFKYLTQTRQTYAEFHEIPRRNHIDMVLYLNFSDDHQYDLIWNFTQNC